MAIFLTLLSFVSTYLGGLFGLHHKDRLHLILGFTAGVLISVVAFDIFPEIIDLLEASKMPAIVPMVALVSGFLIFHVIEKTVLIHYAHEEEYGKHKHPTVGKVSAIALAGHSFMDGMGIGLAFQVSNAIGILVAIAVIAHDFSDGLNTVSLVLAHKNTDRKALQFLLVDSLAPVAGVLATRLFTLPENWLVIYLGFFAGFLLYIGAADILPEAHSEHSSFKTIALTICGAVFIFLVTRVV